jgi:hypothetical protein
MRRRIAPPAGLALLLAGGALLVRVTAMTLAGDAGMVLWLGSAAACVLGGIALILVALPTIRPRQGADEPAPELPRG